MLTSTARRPSRRLPPPDTRQAILDAARKLCFAEGAEGVTARKVARMVGVSATAIYVHYRNLEDLLHHLRMEGHARLATYLRGVDPALPAIERVLAMGRAYFRFGVDHPQYYRLMFLFLPRETPRREAVQQEMFTLLLLRDVVTAGIDAGEIRGDVDAMALTNGLWGGVHGLTSLAVTGLLYLTAEGAADAVLEATLEGFARWLAPAAGGGPRVDDVHRKRRRRIRHGRS
jgi:AcrR family transcriptional regulator